MEFPRWPSELPANQYWPICLTGPLGRHWLAEKSEGHRGISKFYAYSNRFHYFASIENEFLKALFFYHCKLDSHIGRHKCFSLRRKIWQKIMIWNYKTEHKRLWTPIELQHWIQSFAMIEELLHVHKNKWFKLLQSMQSMLFFALIPD